MRIAAHSLIMIFGFNIFSCSNPAEKNSNNAPEITKINVSPLPAEADEWLFFTALAVDKERDLLYFNWSSSAGEFYKGETAANSVAWKSKIAGRYFITCTVSDGKETSEKTLTIDVGP